MIIFDGKMRRVRVFLVILTLLALSSAYNLEGMWHLTATDLSFTQSDPNIKFRFVNPIVVRSLQPDQHILGGPTISYTQVTTQQLTVYACITITYNYYINESSIYLQQVRQSSPNRVCLPNEVEEIQSKLNSTFFFSIENNRLILANPCQNQTLILVRDDSSVLNIPRGTYEEWRLKSLDGKPFSDITEGFVYIGNSSIDACDFNAQYQYTQTVRNNINTKQIKKNCRNLIIQKVIKNLAFYLVTGRSLILYDPNLEELGTLTFQKIINQQQYEQLRLNAKTLKSTNTNNQDALNASNIPKQVKNQTTPSSINPSSNQPPSTTTQPPTAKTTQNFSTTTQPASTTTQPSSTTTQPASTTTQQTQPASTTTQQTQPASTTTQPPSTTTEPTQPASTTTQPASNTTQPTQPASTTTQQTQPASNTTQPASNTTQPASTTTQPTQPASNTTQPASITTQPASTTTQSTSNTPSKSPQTSNISPSTLFFPYSSENSTCLCHSISGLDALTPFSQSLLYNKWYLYAINGSDHNIDQYFYYFMIITKGRMIYYGGCQVKWSFFTLSNNILSNLNTRSFQKSQCLKPNLDDQVLDPFYTEIKYVNYQQNQGIPYIVFYDADLQHVATFHTRPPIYPPGTSL